MILIGFLFASDRRPDQVAFGSLENSVAQLPSSLRGDEMASPLFLLD